jgi:hypothetical protein
MDSSTTDEQLTDQSQKTNEQLVYEELIDKYFYFFINLKEKNTDGVEFNIDWIYLKKKEDDLMLFFLNKIGKDYKHERPVIITKKISTIKDGNTYEMDIETYNDNFKNYAYYYYPHEELMDDKYIIKIINTLSDGIQINKQNNELFILLSDKIMKIIDKYKDNTSLIYDNIILILEEFDCTNFDLNIKLYFLAVKIIYINNKNIYFRSQFRFLNMIIYYVFFSCKDIKQITERFIGSMTYDINPSTETYKYDDKDKPYYSFLSMLIDNITNIDLKFITLFEYNFVTENDYYNIKELIGTDLKLIYPTAKDSLERTEMLLNVSGKTIKNVTSLLKGGNIEKKHKQSVKKIKKIKNKLLKKTVKNKKIKNKLFKKKTVKNKKYRGGFFETAALYYYITNYGPTLASIITGFSGDRAKLQLVNLLLEQIVKIERIIESDVYKYRFNIDNFSSNLRFNANYIPISETYAVKNAYKAKNLESDNKINELDKQLDGEYKYLNNIYKEYHSEPACTKENLEKILSFIVKIQNDIKKNISFYVNISMVYSNLYISKCTNVTKFDYNVYNNTEYVNAYKTLENCFTYKNKSRQNTDNFNKVNELTDQVKKNIIIKFIVDNFRERFTDTWNMTEKIITCPDGRKKKYSDFLFKLFEKILKQEINHDTVNPVKKHS